MLEFHGIGSRLASLQVPNILEKHPRVAVRALKNLCLTVQPELMDSLPAFVSYSAKCEIISVRSSRLIPCEELVLKIELTMDPFGKFVRREASATGS